MAGRKGKLSLDERAGQSSAADKPQPGSIRLDRQQICRTEITAAVRLFLIEQDPISALLLASAAIEIMVALSKGHPDVGWNGMRAQLTAAGAPSQATDELFQSLLHPYNFLKHGSGDFSIQNDFSVEQIIMKIYTAIHSYKSLFGELPIEMKLFYGIVQSWRLHWWDKTQISEEHRRAAMSLGFRGLSLTEMCDRGQKLLLEIISYSTTDDA